MTEKLELAAVGEVMCWREIAAEELDGWVQGHHFFVAAKTSVKLIKKSELGWKYD